MPIRHIGAAALLLGALGAATAQASSPQATSEGNSDMKTSSAATAAAAPLRTLGEYTDPHGIRRLYLLVSPNLSDAQIMTLAQAVHAKEKNAWLWLLDSDEKAAQMMEALPRTAQGDMAGYPAVHRHAAGRTARRACTQSIP